MFYKLLEKVCSIIHHLLEYMGRPFKGAVLIVNSWPTLVGLAFFLETRVKEHFRNIKNGEAEKSAVAAHIWREKHAMDRKPVLLKQTSNKQELTNWKNILINKKKRSHYKSWNPASRPLT